MFWLLVLFGREDLVWLEFGGEDEEEEAEDVDETDDDEDIV